MSDVRIEKLDRGLTLVMEPIPGVASVAMQWLLPAGSASDPADGRGQSSIMAEYLFRGAGGHSSREHSDALDRLGVQRASSVQSYHMVLSANMLGSRFDDALPLITGMVTDPSLDDDALEPVRSLCLQSLASLDDDPQHLVMLHLRSRHLPAPFNRHGYGAAEALKNATTDDIRQAWANRMVPSHSILSFAGAFDPDHVTRRCRELLSGWTGSTDEPVADTERLRGMDRIEQDTSQLHLGLAWDAPPEPHADSTLERLGIAVLSGGTSARLFTEVRQKRSLCYSVGASYRAGRDRGLVSCYAGTTPERAQETLDVCVAEIDRMRQGVTAAEFDRARIGLKSRLIMQGESTRARCGALGADVFRIGHPRSLTDILASIESITLDQLNGYLARREVGDLTIATLGPTELTAPTRTIGSA